MSADGKRLQEAVGRRHAGLSPILSDHSTDGQTLIMLHLSLHMISSLSAMSYRPCLLWESEPIQIPTSIMTTGGIMNIYDVP